MLFEGLNVHFSLASSISEPSLSKRNGVDSDEQNEIWQWTYWLTKGGNFFMLMDLIDSH